MNLPPPEHQLSIFIKNEESPLQIGDIACPINRLWLDLWKEYVDYPKGKDPKEIEMIPINNNKIERNGRLANDVHEGLSFYILKKETYDQLEAWYGGGPRIEIPVIADDQGNPKAITRYLNLSALYKKKAIAVESYSFMKISELHDLVRKSFDIPENVETKLYDLINKNATYLDDNKYVINCNLINNQEILLDSKDENGKYEYENSKNRRMSSSEPLRSSFESTCSSSYHSSSSSSSNAGKCGLRNMGNTCFFNSGTQCMMHTRQLVQYMLSDEWEQDLNIENPIGMRGKLAKAFVSLAKAMWSGNEGSIAPSEFKNVVGRYAPQFSGWGQQDSHELILFALDGVHEDLNRCKKKAIIEAVEGDGTDDDIKAAEAWKRHKLRNDSIIVDLIHGQLRSRLICPNCHSTTIVFDPYMSIQMPINRPHTQKMAFTYIPFEYREKSIPMKLVVPVISGSVSNETVSAAVSKELGKEVNVILAYKTTSYYSSSSTITWEIKEELFKGTYLAFEIPDKNSTYLQCYITEKKEIGLPFLIDSSDFDDDFDTNPKCVIKKLEEKLDIIWNAPKDMKLTTSMEDLKSKIKPSSFGDENKDQKLTVKITKPYMCSDSKSVVKSCPNILKASATVSINGDSNFSYEALLMHTVDESDSGMSEKGKETISLDSCFEYFSVPEILDSDNQWYCPRCLQFVCAEKKLDIYSVPEILIIQLKRFIGGKYSLRKIDAYVDFPEEIDLKEHIVGPQKYEKDLNYRLYAVSNHMGSLHGGHYTAFAKVQDPESEPRKDAPWYSFNDSSASQTSEKSVHTSSAYVLFYERVRV